MAVRPSNFLLFRPPPKNKLATLYNTGLHSKRVGGSFSQIDLYPIWRFGSFFCSPWVIAYGKRGHAENYIKEAKYDMAVRHLLLQSFWANEAIFQLMMLAYHLFLLFMTDFANGTEYRQQIKMFRLKYIFLPGRIIRMARSVIVKLSEKYPYREMYEQSFA